MATYASRGTEYSVAVTRRRESGKSQFRIGGEAKTGNARRLVEVPLGFPRSYCTTDRTSPRNGPGRAGQSHRFGLSNFSEIDDMVLAAPLSVDAAFGDDGPVPI